MLTTTEIMLSEEVRVFVRTIQRVNQTNYLERIRSRGGVMEGKVDFSKPLVEVDT